MGLFSKDPTSLVEVRKQVGEQAKSIESIFEDIDAINAASRVSLDEIQERLERADRRLSLALEEIDERIDRGNKIWRKIRARERYAEGQEEEEESGDEFPPGDVGRGHPQGVLPLPEHVEPSVGERPLHLAIAEEMAQRIAMGE